MWAARVRGGVKVALVRTPLVFFILILVAWSFGLGLVAPDRALAHDHASMAGLHLDKPKGKACIMPTEEMRRNHMNFLKHRRDETVRQGVRVEKDSLLNCQTCHTSRQQFCDKCHEYVGVKPDCFQCHIYK